ncbi:DUF4233 domain-containing protein [Brevibacterium sp. 5221]|uniref:DUF4233 domain-containing protein n=1 Tax=Brevibacterium rongguiense TaxID=2695267 RepID=A0A6N9H905_9MICO|nr:MULTISPECIES: DUF4233 domain-containing protein [Brevibacterium]MYM20503.1 DUF4233 domain-containing protein [Brevibacterium rongguiense]WAL40595.1 DUF4233 domain-containing protein [Brevibacterium sp. BRM-1]
MEPIALPLKSKLPILCGTVLICEVLSLYFALLVGYGLRPVPFAWLVAGAAVITVVAIAATALLPRRAGQRRPGIALGWAVQALILLSGIVMPSMLIVGAVFGAMWVAGLYWGRRIDREATAWAVEHNAR